VTPSLLGRLQTRIFLIAVIGTIWTLLITPLLPVPGAGLGDKYRATFALLVVVLVAGLLWELLYHALQQFRWEKDWPALFLLLNGINEGIAAWFIVRAGWAPFGVEEIPRNAFITHFATTWLITWIFVNGPMRVPFLRWRFQGGRLI
jgi:hypothetical protein